VKKKPSEEKHPVKKNPVKKKTPVVMQTKEEKKTHRPSLSYPYAKSTTRHARCKPYEGTDQIAPVQLEDSQRQGNLDLASEDFVIIPSSA
jgi:hypothetical protein